MWSNYFKIAFRLLTRNKLVSLINIFGLALALSGSLLIAIFIHDEFTYDRFNQQADHIYRVTRNYVRPEGSQIMHLGHLAAPFAPLLKNDFKDIIEATRIRGPFSTTMMVEETGASNVYAVEFAYFAEPSLFKIFSVEIKSGDTRTPLERPFTMMLSEKIAQKYFGNIDVVGKEIHIADTVIEITGTFKTFPNQSHWHPDVLISFSTLNDNKLFGAEQLQNGWENNSFLTYVLVSDQFDPERTTQAFPSFIDKHMPAGGDPIRKSASTNLILQPLTSIHLHSNLDSEAELNGNIDHVYAMGAIGVFLIIIACFNFINLSTARATQLGKEVGLRKVSGALRKQLIFQYINESTLVTFFAMIVAIAITSACLPWLNDFTGKSIGINDYIDVNYILILIGMVIILGVTAGLYPAVVISAYKPAQILKGQIGQQKGVSVRKALVVMQFSISVVIIIATLITYKQLQYINKKDLGYNKDQIVVFGLPEEVRNHYDAFYNALTQHPAIVNVSRTNRMPTLRLLETNNVSTEQRDSSLDKAEVNMKNVSVDQHFFNTYHIPFVSGKNFPKEMKSNGSFEEQVANGMILNESAARILGWTNEEAIGKTLINGGINGTIIGVVKDFHFESLHEPIAPIVFITYAPYRQVSVLVSTSATKAGIDHIEKIWNKFVSQDQFEYEFLNERYNRLYSSEASQQELFLIFAVMTIFIASLGLFGLTTFNAIQRSKEVSIRKILGATVANILKLLSKEIILLTLAANVVAWPIAWYFMSEWLNEFAYHVEMDILPFLTTGVLTLVVTLIIVSTQTVKVAFMNPATILRSE